MDYLPVGGDPAERWWHLGGREGLLEIDGTICAWLNQLSKDVAEKIAYQNAIRLVGKK